MILTHFIQQNNKLYFYFYFFSKSKCNTIHTINFINLQVGKFGNSLQEYKYKNKALKAD